MVAEVTAILALILGRSELPSVMILGKVALWVALVSAFVSAVDYWRRFNVLPATRPAAPPVPAEGKKPKNRISA